jgi:hypothetical protein
MKREGEVEKKRSQKPTSVESRASSHSTMEKTTGEKCVRRGLRRAILLFSQSFFECM